MRVAAQYLLTAVVVMWTAGCMSQTGESPVNQTPEISVVPQPVSVEMLGGVFTLSATFLIQVDADVPQAHGVAEYLAAKVERATGSKPAIVQLDGQPAQGAVVLRMLPAADDLGTEGYALRVEADKIVIEAPQSAGLFYGVQTLLQLLPADIQSAGQATAADWKIPRMSIRDWPRYPYRGMHLDVCRHFFGPESIKRYLDLLALHKMNTFHWHLTEDQGWRIAIEKYPRLTEVGAYRNETLVGHYSDQPHNYDETRYGGFYTQDEVREIVRYAQERFINVIPEIEMPGHSVAALAAYPELSCTGGPFETATRWGVFEDVYCAGNDEVFAFLEGVLAEVAALFPGPYVHIGGDECPKVRWKECPLCQARIREEGLADEHELQSYFIRRAEKILEGHGKRLIGWDEILEGGLAPNATVMSWRGMQGGIAAASQGHDVIMTPGSHCYFDHYQGDPGSEPRAIGGFTPLEKVYAFEPTPAELDAQAAKHVLGAQGNVWTEYMNDFERVEYMALPRMCALSEVVWSPADARDWDRFLGKIDRHFQRLDALSVNYSRSLYAAKILPEYDPQARRTLVTLKTDLPDLAIHYTVDGTPPGPSSPRYTEPIPIDRSMTVQAATVTPVEDGVQVETPVTREFFYHRGTHQQIRLGTAYAQRYSGGGDHALLDGLRGSTSHKDGRWQGYEEVDLDATIDLGELTTVGRISTHLLSETGAWIFLPRRVEVELSDDGETWTSAGTETFPVPGEHLPTEIREVVFDLGERSTRFVRLTAENVAHCPAWHQGAGGKCWIFIDEIVIE